MIDFKPGAVRDLAAKVKSKAPTEGRPAARGILFQDKNRVGQFKITANGKVVTIWYHEESESLGLRGRNELKYDSFCGAKAAAIAAEIDFYLNEGFYQWLMYDDARLSAVARLMRMHGQMPARLWDAVNAERTRSKRRR